jgi:type I restriction enzyme, R subunit
MSLDEISFEEFIANWLVTHGGYQAVKNDKEQGSPRDFDAERGLDRPELFTFIGATQSTAWAELIKRYGGDAGLAQDKFLGRVASEIDKRGTVDVLRHGVVDHGVTLRLAYFRPAHGLTPGLMERYRANRLTVTRQLRYQAGSDRAVDLALFVNGIPVATVELKNQLTGQAVEQAVGQYRHDRDPRNVTLGRRALVHFAVDTRRAMMTTRLQGPATRFLPFNRGNGHGAGNPPNPGGHETAYLWERVWQRDAWLDLLARFVHVEKPAAGRGSRRPGTVIFPRFHQWDCVRRLEDAARVEGVGSSYLVQHSAGSGKSNTIAWLAHRLSTLHDDADRKVFDKVVVITDRVVLDRQLQDTIYQFEHAHGVVERIDKHSGQLAAALAGEQARIIITTLQKFPFILDRVEALPARRYAVIVDEAHSSQTGEAAKELRRVLGAGASTRDQGQNDADLPADEVEDALTAAVEARGRQPNLGFFAFTATPKGRTLELFGRPGPLSGKHEPFHLYSMRQAIEEGFIHDVLASYTTYETFWHIEKTISEDPSFETAKARRAIARFVTLHEHNLAQRAEVVVEHFRQHIARKVAGRAKAMVVTSSRQHAVRFYRALRHYIDQQGYDLGVLVAFSGSVSDDGVEVTESKLNRLPETETADRFDTDDYRLLVVAEKFQTGFDQPKLYAMYVDKTLTGLAAVQTLSRLNRTDPDKDGTFVLDFVNDASEIAKAFEPYYGETVAPPSDPNLLYDTRHALDEFGVLRAEEAEAFARLLLVNRADHGRLHGVLSLAIARFEDLDKGEQDRFRDALARFVRTYSFLSLLVPFGDTSLERDYLFGRALLRLIRADAGETVDLSTAVELTHLRLERQFSGSVSLTGDVGEVHTVYSGDGRQHEPEPEPLSHIIERLNQLYGTDWTDADRLVFDATANDLVNDRTMQAQAVNNTAENFLLVFGERFQEALLGRMERNEQVIFKFLDDPELAREVIRLYSSLVQTRARVAYQEHCPIGELLGPDKESQYLEYKASLRTHPDGQKYKPLESMVIKTVAGFLNSRDGGTLLIGVADDGTVVGLEGDYASLRKAGRDDRDLFQLHLAGILVAAMGEAAATNVGVQIHTVDGKAVCRVHVRPSAFPVEAKVTLAGDKGQLYTKTAFYVRLANGTREISDPAERHRYAVARWGSPQRGGLTAG